MKKILLLLFLTSRIFGQSFPSLESPSFTFFVKNYGDSSQTLWIYNHGIPDFSVYDEDVQQGFSSEMARVAPGTAVQIQFYASGHNYYIGRKAAQYPEFEGVGIDYSLDITASFWDSAVNLPLIPEFDPATSSVPSEFWQTETPSPIPEATLGDIVSAINNSNSYLLKISVFLSFVAGIQLFLAYRSR